MMTRLGTIVFVTLAISACSSTPPAEPQQTVSVEESSQPATVDSLRAEMYAEEEVVCRFEKTVGSRLGKRVCRTKSQREAEEIAGQKALERNAIMHDQETKIGSGE